MGVIRSLMVNLSANTASFASKMGGAGNTLKRFVSDAAEAGKGLAKLGAAAAAAGTAVAVGAGAAIAAVTKKSMDSIDATAKAADQLGMTTEAYIGLRHAADLAGVGGEAFNSMMARMVNAVGEAAVKGGPVADTLEAIGLSAQTLSGLAPDQMFALLADAVSGLASPTDQAVVAMDLFGRQGIAMLSVLAEGSAGLREMAADAERLGISFSRVDAAKVEAANDAVSRLWKVFEGLGNQIAIQLAPWIEAAANKLTDLGVKGLNGGNTVVKAFEWISLAVAKTADLLNLFTAGWQALKAGVLLATAGVLTAIDWVGSKLTELLNLIPGVELEWTETFTVMADSVLQDAIQAAGKFDEALSRFYSGEKQQQVSAFFENLRREADEAAKVATARTGGQIGGPGLAAGIQRIEMERKAEKERQEELRREQERQRREQEAFQKKIAQTEMENDPMLKLANRYGELQDMLAGGLSKGAFEKEFQAAVDDYQTAVRGGGKQTGGTSGRLGAMGVEFFKENGRESQEDLLRQINATMERIEKQNSMGMMAVDY